MKIGGYDEIPLMEDWNMSKALYRDFKVKVLKKELELQEEDSNKKEFLRHWFSCID